MRAPITYSKALPLGLTSFKGINMPWLITNEGDGYSVGFTTYWDESDIVNKVSLAKKAGVKYLRIWLNMAYYMTTDVNGFTGFNATFLSNLDTLINTIIANAGMKAYVCMSDSNVDTSFKWSWLNNPIQSANYIEAYHTLFLRYTNDENIWAWDFCNEPMSNYVSNGVTRATLLAFFTSIYNDGKSTSPNHYFSVGARTPSDSDFDVCSDFYDHHPYNSSGVPTYYSSQYSQPVIISECGHPSNFAQNTGVVRQYFVNGLTMGFNMIMPWDLKQITSLDLAGADTYRRKSQTLDMIQGLQEPSHGAMNF